MIKRVWIDKPGSREQRPLGIPTVCDRGPVVQGPEDGHRADLRAHLCAPELRVSARAKCKDALRRMEELLQSGHASWWT